MRVWNGMLSDWGVLLQGFGEGQGLMRQVVCEGSLPFSFASLLLVLPNHVDHNGLTGLAPISLSPV